MATNTWRGGSFGWSLLSDWVGIAPVGSAVPGGVVLTDPPADTVAIVLDATTTELRITATESLTATSITAGSAAGPTDTITLGAATLVLQKAASFTQVAGRVAVVGAGTFSDAGAFAVRAGTLAIAGGLAGGGDIALAAGALLTVGGTLSGDRRIDLGAGATLASTVMVGAQTVTLGQGAALSVARLIGAPTISLAGGAAVTLQQATSAVPMIILGDGAQRVTLPGTGALTPTLTLLHAGDLIDFVSVSSVPDRLGDIGGAAQSGGTLYVSGASGQNANVTVSRPARRLRFAVAPDDHGGTLVLVACFAQGTRIATAHGERPVEALRPGALVRTAGGALAPVRWVGRTRIDLAAHPASARAAPVRVRAGAVAEGVPRRDLRLSPEHCLLIAGALVPVGALVNGATIAREDDLAEIIYWHVELDRHDVLLAEGLACESYLDTGNRGLFAGEAGVRALHPDLVASPASALRIWAAHGCAPLRASDPDARAALRARAHALGWRLTETAGLRIAANGVAVPTTIGAAGAHAALPAGTTRVTLRSASFVPGELDGESGDLRRLGVAAQAVLLNRWPLHPDALAEGWHAQEGEPWRWSDGAASLTLPRLGRPGALLLRLAPLGRYWRAPPAIDGRPEAAGEPDTAPSVAAGSRTGR